MVSFETSLKMPPSLKEHKAVWTPPLPRGCKNIASQPADFVFRAAFACWKPGENWPNDLAIGWMDCLTDSWMAGWTQCWNLKSPRNHQHEPRKSCAPRFFLLAKDCKDFLLEASLGPSSGSDFSLTTCQGACQPLSWNRPKWA